MVAVVSWSQRRAELHLQGQHDQQTHGNRGGRHWDPEPDATPAERRRWDSVTDLDTKRPVEYHPYDRTYRVRAANGTHLEATIVGNDRRLDTPEWRQRTVDILNGLGNAYDMAPVGDAYPPRILVTPELPFGMPDAALSAVAMVRTTGAPSNERPTEIPWHGDNVPGNTIMVNASETGDVMWELTEQTGADWMMPVFAPVGAAHYVGAHEYGHVRHSLGADLRATIGDLFDRIRPTSLADRRPEWTTTSRYARTNPSEAHAEAFAEWALTDGTTSNPFSQLYAEALGWGPADERALAAAGPADDVVDGWWIDTPHGPGMISDDGEVTMWPLDDTEEFHQRGQHDQKTHGNRAGRIAPVTGTTVRTGVVNADLTMDGDWLTDKTRKAITNRLESALGVDEATGVDHLVDIAGHAFTKGLPGRDWYQEAHDAAVAVADGSGIDPEVAVGIVAALSPGTPWDENQRNAHRLMEAFGTRDQPLDPAHIRNTNVWANKPDGKTGVRNSEHRAHPDDTFNTLYERDPKLAAVYLAKKANASIGYSYDNFFKATELMVRNDPAAIDEVLAGTKVRSFYNNLAHPRGDHGDVTVDVHMMRAIANDTSSTTPTHQQRSIRTIATKNSQITGSPSQDGAQLGAMPVMADIVRQATDRFNGIHGTDLLPHQFQAVVWVEQLTQYPPRRITRIQRGEELLS